MISRSGPFRIAAMGVIATLLAACTGPTKTGLEVRKAAHDRFNRVGSAVAMDQANQALHAGQFKDALTHIDRAVTAFPDDAKARLLRGRIVLEMGRLELAMTEFKNSSTLDPSCDECHYYEGVIYQRWGRDDEALRAYEAALTLVPNNTHYLLAQAETLVALGRIGEANQLIEDSECHFEFNSALAHLRAEIAMAEDDMPRALRNLELAVTLASDPTVYQEDLAHAAFRAGEWDRCLNALDAIPERVRDRDDLSRARARCLAMTGRQLEARDALLEQEKRAIARGESTSTEHDVALGYIASMIGDWPRVDLCARRLIGRSPLLADGFVMKGMVAESQGDLTTAIQFFRKATELDPARRMSRNLLARAEALDLASGGTLAGIAVR
jgi:tetratricopeptide (TPR) repeat protein